MLHAIAASAARFLKCKRDASADPIQRDGSVKCRHTAALQSQIQLTKLNGSPTIPALNLLFGWGIVLAYLIRIEGCDFAATLFDTEKLSVIRGASRAYLKAPELFRRALATKLGLADAAVKTIAVGASDAILHVETTPALDDASIRAALNAAWRTMSGSKLAACLPHLSFTFGIVTESADYRTDVMRLVAQCRAGQFQRPTHDLPPKPNVAKLGAAAQRPCIIDRSRPVASTTVKVPGESAGAAVSASVAARITYGREQRQAFYAEELEEPLKVGNVDLTVADSFEDLVAPAPSGLPPQLHNKMAVVYLDGNKCTAIREAVIFGEKSGDGEVRLRQTKFSDFMRGARRKFLKRILLGHLASQQAMMLPKSKVQDEDVLRFETLLWGGDECLFVMPAWPVLSLLKPLHEALVENEWIYEGYKISHGIGILICNVKTPISVAKKLAQELADTAKPLAKVELPGKKLPDYRRFNNVLSLQILESVEPPQHDLQRFRAEFYGTSDPRAFTMVGDEITKLAGLVAEFKKPGGLPRSQIYGLINSARAKNLVRGGSEDDCKAFWGWHDGKNKIEGELERAFIRSGSRHLIEAWQQPLLGFSETDPQSLLPLIRLAELWDYVDPFGAEIVEPPATVGAA